MSLWGPFFLGGMLALALNVPLRAVERRLPAQMRHRRKAALGAVLIFTASALVILFAMVVPQLAESAVRLTKAAPQLWQRVQAALQRQLVRTPALKLILGGAESLNFEALVCRAAEKLRGAHWMGGTVDLAAQAAGWAADLGVGLVLAAYLLARKEELAAQASAVLDAWLPPRAAHGLKHIGSVFGAAFAAFFSGQCLEAALLGAIFALVLLICHFPCAVLISVMIGITALVPIFGTFVGCAFGTVVILALEPQRLVWFWVLFLCIQQLEGAFLYPRVVGGKVGLPPLWVLVAVTLGGKLFGAAGMLGMIPVFSAGYTLAKEKTCERLKKLRDK